MHIKALQMLPIMHNYVTKQQEQTNSNLQYLLISNQTEYVSNQREEPLVSSMTYNINIVWADAQF